MGLPNSGKTTLFNALTKAGAEITAYATVSDKANVGHGDDRRRPAAGPRCARRRPQGHAGGRPRASTSREPGRSCSGTSARSTRSSRSRTGSRARRDPQSDLETLELELLVADRDHVERRLERVQKEAKSGDAAKRKEAETLERLLAHLEAGRSLADWPEELPAELEPLTTKPLIPLVNGPVGIDFKLEAELAELPDEEAAEFRDGPSALDEVDPQAAGGARPDHVLHGRRQGDPRVDAATGRDGPRRRGHDPLGHRARLHPLRGDPGRGLPRRGLPRRGREARPAAPRGQDLRRRGRRRAQHPLQRR